MSVPRASSPIPIAGAGHHARARSDSESTNSSTGSSPPHTPMHSRYATLPRIQGPAAGAVSGTGGGGGGGGGPGGSPTSPILSFLAGQSPMKSPAAYPFTRTPFASAVDDEDAAEPPVVRHARRASITAAGPPRFSANPAAVLQGSQQDRGAGLLRRLSLGGAFAKPAPPTPFGKPKTPPPIMEERAALPPPSSARTPPVAGRKRRSATLGVDARPRRAPSPMGERILKGHFDGFN